MAETDENASTGEQAGRERLGSTSGNELAALSHAHSKRGPTEGQKTGSEVQSERDIKGVSFREPKVQDSLSWPKQKIQNLLPISAAVSSFNNFDNDGSFMHKFLQMQNEDTNKLMVEEDKTRNRWR
ncbi:hypothetical protein ACJW30_02G076900 [Castanea mollissima]